MSEPPIYHLKILVPSPAAGRIIGKGGTTIAQLQKLAGAKVKMSKASEFYPGTTDRVCLISGPPDGILQINDFFLDNFSSSTIKILVPNSTAGMIIGKGGCFIKQIKEDSGAYVQISQKSPDLSMPERCVTVVGELDDIRRACAMIMSKIVEDVGSGNCLNINYRDSPRPIAPVLSLSPIKSPCLSSPPIISQTQQTLSCTTTPTNTSTDINSAQMIETIKTVLRVSGYGEDAVSEITSAMSTLASYGVLGVGLGLL